MKLTIVVILLFLISCTGKIPVIDKDCKLWKCDEKLIYPKICGD